MPSIQDPNLGLNYGWDLGEDNWKDGMDANLLKLGAVVAGAVEGVAAAPTVTTPGARYIVAASPSGAFATATANQLAVRVGTTWMFYTPQTGWDFFNKSTGTIFRFTGSAWVEDTTTSTAQLARRHEDNLMGGVAGIANSPSVTTDGTRYIVGSAPTGAFAAATANQIAARSNGAWIFYTPFNGQKIYNYATSTDFRFNGSAWIEDSANATSSLARRHEDNLMGGVEGVANSPTITTDGTRYIVGSAPTGAFSAATANQIAARYNSAWNFYTPFTGQRIYNKGVGTDYQFNGTAWAAVSADGPLATKHENMWTGPATAVANAPTVTTNGTRYIVGTAPTGAFAGQANKLAVMVSGSWVFYAPYGGMEIFNIATGTMWLYDGTAWANTLADTPAAKAALLSTIGATPAGVREFMEQYGFTASYMNDSTDLNTITGSTDRTVCFGWNASTANIPVAGSYGRGIMIAGGGNNSTQLAWVNTTGAMYIRFHNGTSWAAWAPFLLSSQNTWSSMQIFDNSISVGNFNTSSSGMEFGNVTGAATTPYIDFHSGATPVDYDVRLLVLGGNGTMGNGQLVINASALRPGDTNVTSLGDAATKWTTVYATNATISTSDARLKTDPREMTLAEISAFALIARLPNLWKWLERVEEEGDKARLHSGPTVQAAIAIMEAHGLVWSEYSCFCYDRWDAVEESTTEVDGKVKVLIAAREAGDRYSFRKEELLMLITRALAYKQDEMEARIFALEEKFSSQHA